MASVDTNRNLVAALSYFLGFITGLIVYLVEKDDKFVRFHAMQSILIFGSLFVVNIIFELFIRNFIGVFASVLSLAISLSALVVWVVSMIKAFRGEVYKWPVVGDIAERKVKNL
jgi:uncharacterized membrane protein